MSEPRDSLYADPLGKIDGFSFDEQVARVFPDMLRRSIPGYGTILTQCGLLAEKYARDNSDIYDLGCSLGATTFAMRKRIQRQGCRIIAVDNSPAMIERCRQLLAQDPDKIPVDLQLADIADIEITRASIVSLNFTLQFFAPERRRALLQGIYDGLLPGGVLILSEKICFSDPRQQALHTEMYHAFKAANGYSELEISQKRTALENVLIPDTLPEHHARLQACGFSSSEVWFQCFNFASIIALK
ncbi:MAG: carboxy-S-adenosyl-L-methionine synthase CmoA [Gammaproteobacteria bacterium]|nr:carboxy-S-adenosyl-L-methionine synthase CmoA [Gammaproteobacteria bacterium]